MTNFKNQYLDVHGSSLSYEDRYVNHAPELLETQARRRRLNLFKSLTGFKEVRRQASYFERVPRSHRDHTSFWSDGVSDYVLCEPYRSDLPEKLNGLVVIVLPVEIGPYGGRWSDDPAAQPGTTSLLFGSDRQRSSFDELRLKFIIDAWDSPRWNVVES